MDAQFVLMDITARQRDHTHVRLDVARGLSALIVFVCHIIDTLFYRVVGTAGVGVAIAATFARHAVLIFFLLSGHLITKSVLSNIKRHGAFSISDYASARISRIYPPLIGSIAICLLSWGVIHFFKLPGAVQYGLPGDLYRVRDNFSFHLGEVLDALNMTGGLLNVNGPLWTLFIEVQIYILAASVSVFTRRDRISWALGVIAALWALSLLRHQFFLVSVWCLGALTAFWRPSRKFASVVALLCVLAVACMIIDRRDLGLVSPDVDTVPQHFLQISCSIIYCVVLFFMPFRLRYPRFLIATGNFSYSLYIVHAPLLLLTLSLTQNWIAHSLQRTWIVALISFFLILPFTVLFARVAEAQDYYKRLLTRR